MTVERSRAVTLRDFRRLAQAFARRLQPGDAVALSGELGAGKTTFVRAAVEALHGAENASSPTFTFRHTYPGRPRVEHLDLYRLESVADATELGLHEAFSPESIVFVEWPERFASLLPPDAIRIAIVGAGEASREILIERPE
jgi:tRNA threonylcarbamoyl adenosine modification protein YjeE